MKLTCIANHPGIDVPENFQSEHMLKCGVCGLPMRDQLTLQPSMSGGDFDGKVGAYFKAAHALAREKFDASMKKPKADGEPADAKEKDASMGLLMMSISGSIFVGFFEKALRELIVGAPDESVTLAIAADAT